MVDILSGVPSASPEAANQDKMEIVARLARGVAHEFNNLLAVILLHSDMLINTPGVDDAVRHRGREIKGATERAAALTRQLLALGGRQVMQPKPVDVNGELERWRPLFQRKSGQAYKVVIRPAVRNAQVNVDPVHLEQIMLNLVLNARDAMPAGGQIMIITSVAEIKEDDSSLALPAGSYIKITVSDHGVGMDAATRSRVFDPFFTTKIQGKGVGLGLSTVFGIVKQSGGEVVIESELGKGTSVTVYLPQLRIETGPTSLELEIPFQGTETILLVEDEEMVRNAAAEMLSVFGYQVIEAANGRDALEACEESDETISVVLTDISMDEMDGPSLAAAINTRWPAIPVILMSGLTELAVASEGLLKKGIPFIEKPFEPMALARLVRKTIDAARGEVKT
jgi:CheY-like chemotaxis protein